MTDAPSDLDYFEPIGLQPGSNRPEVNPFELLDFELLVLRAGESTQLEASGREIAIVPLTGSTDITVDGHRFESVGGRSSVFDGPPDTVYAPSGTTVTIEPLGDTEVAICSVRTESDDPALEAYRVTPDEVTQGQWGSGNTTRTYDFIINGERPSQRLYIAEVTVKDGRWATYPPHKHEEDGLPGQEVGSIDHEIFQEEYYFYRVDPEQGFGFAGLYGGKVGAEKAFVIRNNTLHKIPFGYHTLTAAPGYSVYYLAAYAGRAKDHAPYMDPNHRWLANGTPAPAPEKPE